MYPAQPDPKDTPRTDKVLNSENLCSYKELSEELTKLCKKLEYEAALYKWKYEELADRT